MTIALIVAFVLLLGFAVAFSENIKMFFYFLWFITGGAWVELFKNESYSTGNGAGIFGKLMVMAICGIHVLLVAGFGIGLLINWLVF